MKKPQIGFARVGKEKNEVTIYLLSRKFRSFNYVWLNITYFKQTGCLTHCSFLRGSIECLIGMVRTDIVKISRNYF